MALDDARLDVLEKHTQRMCGLYVYTTVASGISPRIAEALTVRATTGGGLGRPTGV